MLETTTFKVISTNSFFRNWKMWILQTVKLYSCWKRVNFSTFHEKFDIHFNKCHSYIIGVIANIFQEMLANYCIYQLELEI